MNSIPLSDFPGTNNLFNDFLNSSKDITLDSFSYLIDNLAKNNYNRNKILDSINNTLSFEKLSIKQKENYKLIESENTFVIVSGQQAGLLGGSLYTLLKSLDTVRISRELSSYYPNYNFVPIFWIEDNDDDLQEASSTYFFDKNSFPTVLNLHFESNACVSSETIKDSDIEIINAVISLIANHQYSNDLSEIISSSYQIGLTWSECFIQLYQRIIGETGILFLSAAKLMESGIFKDLVIEELSEFRRSLNSIEKRNAELIEKDFHIQANPSEINLFFHKNGKRFKIERNDIQFSVDGINYNFHDFISLAESQPENFCPKVLLRPVFQDFALPTVAYIAGPGEIAYQNQINYLYDDFRVIKPLVLMRTTATIIEKRISRYLTKIEKQPEYFFNDFREIEKELANQLLGDMHEVIFNDFKDNFNKEFLKLEEYLLSIDEQLERSIKGSLVKIQEQIDQLDKKAHSAAKRSNDELLQKYKSCSNSIFPLGKPQERVISPIYYLAQNMNIVEMFLENKVLSAINHKFIEL